LRAGAFARVKQGIFQEILPDAKQTPLDLSIAKAQDADVSSRLSNFEYTLFAAVLLIANPIANVGPFAYHVYVR